MVRKLVMSFKARRLVAVLCMALVVVVIYWYFNRRGLRWYAETHWPYSMDPRFSKRECRRTREQLDALIDVAHRTFKTFEKLGVTSFLTYGSLFGGLRYRGPVPWDIDIDMGVIGKTIDQYSFGQLEDAFRKEGMEVEYQAYGGLYKLRKGGASVDIFPYYNTYGGKWLYRNGWESYFFFVNYWYHHVIPKRLVKEPLPKIEFGGLMMNITHGRYRLQTYLFRDDWNREVRPRGCEKAEVGPQRSPIIVTYAPEDADDWV